MMNKMRQMEGVLLVLLNLIRVCDHTQGNFNVAGRHVSLTFKPHQPVSLIQGDSVSLECSYNSILKSFTYLKWFHNNENIATYDMYEGNIRNDTNNNYKFDKIYTLRTSVLEIPEVNFTRDTGNYTCEVQFQNESSGTFNHLNKTVLVTVHVPVKDVTIFDQTNQHIADVAHLTSGQAYNFTCVVPNINPAATLIKWTLGNDVPTHRTPSSITEPNGLSTTTSTVSLTVALDNHNEVLSCYAENGPTGKSANVTLDVKVLPTKPSIHLFEYNGLLADGETVTIELFNTRQHNFVFNVTITRPNASINCYLGEELLEMYKSTTRGDGLVNTTRVFFISNSIESHNKQLKCNATTSDSKDSLSVQVTVLVDAPSSVRSSSLMILRMLGVLLAMVILISIILKNKIIKLAQYIQKQVLKLVKYTRSEPRATVEEMQEADEGQEAITML